MSKQLILLSSLLLCATPLLAADKLPPIEPPMVNIKGGEFMMGSTRYENSQPVHAVTIKPFRMGKFEVTGAEFQRFVEATNYRTSRMCLQLASKRWFENVPDEYGPAATTLQTVSKFEPATCISWSGADAYVKWLAKETGKKYRLPTESEWEYASRAGSSTRYFFGNDESLACRYGNLADRSAEAAVRRDFGLESKNHVGVIPCDDKAGYASIVGMYEPNAFGVYDTLGNVSEFLADCWRENYDGAPKDGSILAGGECKERSLRGGSWHWRGFHESSRSRTDTSAIGALAGFRVAEDIAFLPTADAKSSAFELELAQAQQAERVRRGAIPEIPRPAS
ncbi:MAG: SUMF1/EgtB/PvdO family nonheme iron enzyme [Pseudomonadota bacterium]